MKILICGAGYIGLGLVRILSENNDLVILDSSVDKLRQCAALDVQTVLGEASNPDILFKAGAATTDMIIATTQYDEVNLIACQIAHSLFHIPIKIARVRAEGFHKLEWQSLFSHNQLAVDAVISPEIEVARTVLNRLKIPDAIEVIPLAKNFVQILCISIKKKCPGTNKPLGQLLASAPELGLSLIGIMRQGHFSFPNLEEPALLGDEVYFLCLEKDRESVLALFGISVITVGNVLIVGGGNIGYHAALQLDHEKNIRTRIVEFNKERALYLAGLFERTLVIQGSGLDPDILKEADIENTHAMVAITDDDRTNLLSCVLAKHERCQRTISLVKNSALTPFVRYFGIDGLINPWTTTISTVLRYLRRGRIRTLHSLYQGLAEIHEIDVSDHAPIVGQILSPATLPEGIQLVSIIRQDILRIAERFSLRIEKGDTLVIAIMASAIPEAEKLFRSSSDFF